MTPQDPSVSTDEEFDEQEVDSGSGGVETDATGDESVLEDLAEIGDVVRDDPLAVALHERDEYLDALRRLQAEFDNYRKRVTRQQTELLERATESLIERLLPSLDALDLAVAHAGEPADPSGQQLVAALGQIAALLRDTLSREGLERIDETEVDFDPTVHDAVAHDPAEDGDRHGAVVAEVMRPGYRLKSRVVRPAMVRVRG